MAMMLMLMLTLDLRGPIVRATVLPAAVAGVVVTVFIIAISSDFRENVLLRAVVAAAVVVVVVMARIRGFVVTADIAIAVADGGSTLTVMVAVVAGIEVAVKPTAVIVTVSIAIVTADVTAHRRHLIGLSKDSSRVEEVDFVWEGNIKIEYGDKAVAP
ncbi:hypothetical protein F5Y07DRAFT_395726 [Xylaria sp. FL0933]|nr:hypothetical protein F5Y07DRAFT_395726 [Xylaria sp. FL0933]